MIFSQFQLKNLFKSKSDYIQNEKNLVFKLGLFIVIIAVFIYISSKNYLFSHTSVELFSCAIIFSVFIIAINTLQISKNNYFTFLGIAYGFVGFFDILHTLTYKGMGVLTGFGANLPTQLWIIARYMESLSLVIVFIFFYKNLRVCKVVFIYSLISGLLLLSIFEWGIFPDCYIVGDGLTFFKIISEYIISCILMVSFILLKLHREKLSFDMYLFVSGAIVTTIMAELCFTLYINVYGPSNMLGHLFKIVSFYLMYKIISKVVLKKPYTVLFHELKQERDKLNENIIEARRVQKAMLPNELPVLAEVDFISWNVFAEKVGGDFYDIFVIDEGHLGFYLVDVSGHGLDAALMTTFIKSNISFQSMNEGEKQLKSPREVILDLNIAYQNENFPADKFVSVLCGILNYKTGKVKFSATGFTNFPIKFNTTGAKRLVCSGKVINSYINNINVEEKEIRLNSGDYLFLSTDGIIEEINENGEMYGEERLINVLSSLAGLEVKKIMEEVKTDFSLYVGKEEYTDDITCMLLKMK